MAGLLLKRAMVARRAVRFHRGDPGFFGSLAKGIGKVVGTVAKVAAPIARVVPGLGTVAGIASLAGGIISKPKIPQLPAFPKVPGLQFGRPPSTAGLPNFGTVVGGASSTHPARRRRRMNPMNHKAANRAIRRIKAVRKIVRSIESSLPKQRATAPRRFGKKC